LTARETVLRAHKALLNGSGELFYFEDRYRITSVIPLSQCHAGHILSRLKRRAA
jgi:hypothetical protein